MLDFRITDAEFSTQLGRIVAVSNAPSSRLRVYDPVTRTGTSTALPFPAACVSVGPDGTHAVVGHDSWITWVDLTTTTVLDTIPVTTNVGDVVLAGNGYAYAFPLWGGWGRVHCIELATRTESMSNGYLVSGGMKGKLHPSGTAMYGADNGLFPSDIERIDISQGTANALYDSPYHGTYLMGGDLWLSEDGLRIFVLGGNTFRSSPIRAEDMIYSGSLSGFDLVQWIDESAETSTVLAIPRTPTVGGGLGSDTNLHVFGADLLDHRGTYTFPQVRIGRTDYSTHGRFVFFEANGERAWAVVRVDPSSSVLLDDGIVDFELVPQRRPLRGDVGSVSISAGGVQNLALDAGPAHAHQIYLVLGSLGGAFPGIQLGAVQLPLNFETIYFAHTLTSPNQWPLVDSLGFLDASGQAHAAFDIRSNAIPPSVAGTVVYHAFLVLDPAVGPAFASNAERLLLDS